MANEAWIKRQTESPEARRRYEEERLILWTTEAIWKAMDNQGLTRAELAVRLGTSRANVTQLLSGTRNMTLRSLAGLAHACGLRADVNLEELADSVFTELDEHAAAVPIRFTIRGGSWPAATNDEAEDGLDLFAAPGDPGTCQSTPIHPASASLALVA